MICAPKVCLTFGAHISCISFFGAEKIYCCFATKRRSAEEIGEGRAMICGRRSREPPTIRMFCKLILQETKKHPTKGCFLFGAEKRICAFSGAPRWTMINCPFCLMRKRKPLFARQNARSRKMALLTQSCSLCSVTFTPTYRRSLISHLQDVINALPDG